MTWFGQRLLRFAINNCSLFLCFWHMQIYPCLKMKIVASVLSALTLTLSMESVKFIQLRNYAFKTKELVFDLKPKIFHGNLGVLSVPFNKMQRIQGVSQYPSLQVYQMLVKKLQQEEDLPKETEYQFLLHSLKTHRQGAVVQHFIFTTSNSCCQIGCLWGRKKLPNIDYQCIFCKTSFSTIKIPFSFEGFQECFREQRAHGMWLRRVTTSEVPGALKRKNLVTLLSIYLLDFICKSQEGAQLQGGR